MYDNEQLIDLTKRTSKHYRLIYFSIHYQMKDFGIPSQRNKGGGVITRHTGPDNYLSTVYRILSTNKWV